MGMSREVELTMLVEKQRLEIERLQKELAEKSDTAKMLSTALAIRDDQLAEAKGCANEGNKFCSGYKRQLRKAAERKEVK
jgi:hypothetical protein